MKKRSHVIAPGDIIISKYFKGCAIVESINGNEMRVIVKPKGQMSFPEKWNYTHSISALHRGDYKLQTEQINIKK